MRKFLWLAAALVIFGSSAHAAYNTPITSVPATSITGVVGIANGGTNAATAGAALSNLGGLKAWPTQRPPTYLDDSAHGYTANRFWSYGGNLWESVSVAAGNAVWQPRPRINTAACDAVTGCLGAYGSYRLSAAYAGNLFTLTRSSDSTTLNVGFAADNYTANWPAVDAFCLNTSCGFSTVYDQSGNGYNLTQATFANMPKVFADQVGSLRGMTFNATSGEAPSAFEYLTSTTLALTNVQNFTVVETMNNFTSGPGQAMFELGSPTIIFDLLGAFSTGTLQGLGYSNNPGGEQFLPAAAMAGNEVFMAVANAGSLTVTQNDQPATGAQTLASNAATGIRLGYTTTLGGSMAGTVTSFVIYNSALSAANQQIELQIGYQATGIQPQAVDTCTYIGDSIFSGYMGTPSINPIGQRVIDQVRNAAVHPCNRYLWGHYGEALATMVNEVQYELPLGYNANAQNFMLIHGGTNDVANNSTPAATLFGYYQSVCTTAHTKGFKCDVASMLPRAGSAGNTFDTIRTAFNTQLSTPGTGWQSFADGYADFGGDPVIGTLAAGNSTTYYPDGIHPTYLTSTYMAKDIQAGMAAQLQ